MGAQATAVVDFGAFPGSCDASVPVTGQATLLATSLIEAWIYPPGNAATTPLNAISGDGTADHMGEEHRVEKIKISIGAVIAGTGFTIYATAEDNPGTGIKDESTGVVAKDGVRLYGKWCVAWVWN